MRYNFELFPYKIMQIYWISNHIYSTSDYHKCSLHSEMRRWRRPPQSLQGRSWAHAPHGRHGPDDLPDMMIFHNYDTLQG